MKPLCGNGQRTSHIASLSEAQPGPVVPSPLWVPPGGGPFAVEVEDRQQLDGPTVRSDPVRSHRRELRRLPGLDEDLEIAEEETSSS